MRAATLIIAAIFAVGSHQFGRAQEIGGLNFPEDVLGRGFDSKRLQFTKPCLSFQKPTLKFDGKPSDIYAELIEISDETNLRSHSQRKFSGSLSYGMGSFSASVFASLAADENVSKYRRTFVGSVYSEFPKQQIVPNPPSPEIVKLAGEGGDKFREQCGDYFVVAAFYGGSADVKVVVETEGLEQRKNSSVDAAVGFSASALKAQFRANFASGLEYTSKQAKKSITFRVRGGTRQNLENLSKIEEYIKDVQKGFLSEISKQPWILRIELAPYSAANITVDTYNEVARERRLARLFAEKTSLIVYRETIKTSLLDPFNASLVVPPAERGAIATAMRAIGTRLNEIQDIVDTCADAISGNRNIDSLCSVEALSVNKSGLQNFQLPELPTGFCRQSTIDGTCLRCEFEYDSETELADRNNAKWNSCPNFAQGTVRVIVAGEFLSKGTLNGGTHFRRIKAVSATLESSVGSFSLRVTSGISNVDNNWTRGSERIEKQFSGGDIQARLVPESCDTHHVTGPSAETNRCLFKGKIVIESVRTP